jgi:hypothetical protein
MTNKQLIALSIWNTYKFNVNNKNNIIKSFYKDKYNFTIPKIQYLMKKQPTLPVNIFNA